MSQLLFRKLNDGWNAEPNAPHPGVQVSGTSVVLRFLLNPFEFDEQPHAQGVLTFSGCSRWRLGPTNDEGWYRGQCRYSEIAPTWGEFYEIEGSDPVAEAPQDWHRLRASSSGERHFLFYLRDDTFESFAADWQFTRSA